MARAPTRFFYVSSGSSKLKSAQALPTTSVELSILTTAISGEEVPSA